METPVIRHGLLIFQFAEELIKQKELDLFTDLWNYSTQFTDFKSLKIWKNL